MRRPDLFIVGAPRCGTTAMHRYLKAHPQIFMSEQKEIFYFGSDYKAAAEQVASKLLTAKNVKRVGKFSLSYRYSPDAQAYRYLRDHPEIFMSYGKEPYHFGSDFTSPPRTALEHYLFHFAAAKNEKRVGEASTVNKISVSSSLS